MAQAQSWEDITYDSLVSFKLPAGYTLKDTAGSKIYQSEIEDTTYIISFVEKDNGFRFESEASIDAFYTDFFEVIVNQAGGPVVLKKDIIEFGKFRALRATLVRKVIVKELTWEILLFQIKNTTINFQCITQKGAKAQYDRLLTSIQFNAKLNREDQIGHPTNHQVRSAFDERIIVYGAGGIFIAIILFLIFRKKKK